MVCKEVINVLDRLESTGKYLEGKTITKNEYEIIMLEIEKLKIRLFSSSIGGE